MFGFNTFTAGIILGGAASLFAMRYHVVQSNEGLIVLPRSNQPPVRSVYVDVRKWNVAMWKQYPEVAEAMVKSGRGDLMITGAVNTLFPGRVEETPLENLGTAVQDTSQQVLKSLVPIKFTPEPRTRERSTPPDSDQWPEPHLGASTEVLPDRINSARQPATSVGIGVPFSSTMESVAKLVLPQGLNPSPLGLPELKPPVPLTEQQYEELRHEALEQAIRPQSRNDDEPEDWVRGLLQSLIPSSDQTATHQQNDSHARIPVTIEAPTPKEEVHPPDSEMWWDTTPHSIAPPIRAVRPF